MTNNSKKTFILGMIKWKNSSLSSISTSFIITTSKPFSTSIKIYKSNDTSATGSSSGGDKKGSGLMCPKCGAKCSNVDTFVCKYP